MPTPTDDKRTDYFSIPTSPTTDTVSHVIGDAAIKDAVERLVFCAHAREAPGCEAPSDRSTASASDVSGRREVDEAMIELAANLLRTVEGSVARRAYLSSVLGTRNTSWNPVTGLAETVAAGPDAERHLFGDVSWPSLPSLLATTGAALRLRLLNVSAPSRRREFFDEVSGLQALKSYPFHRTDAFTNRQATLTTPYGLGAAMRQIQAIPSGSARVIEARRGIRFGAGISFDPLRAAVRTVDQPVVASPEDDAYDELAQWLAEVMEGEGSAAIVGEEAMEQREQREELVLEGTVRDEHDESWRGGGAMHRR